MFKCQDCGSSFSRRDNLTRHVKTKHGDGKSFDCGLCGITFGRLDNLQQHNKKFHEIVVEAVQPSTSSGPRKRPADEQNGSMLKKLKARRCQICDVDVPIPVFNNHLRSTTHKNKLCCSTKNKDIEVINSAFKSRLLSYRVKCSEHVISIEDFLQKVKNNILQLLDEALIKHKTFKMNLELFGFYAKYEKDGNVITDTKSFNTKNEVVSESTDKKEIYNKMVATMTTKSEEFQERDSGWVLLRVLYIEVNMNKYNPLHASSYIELPAWIKRKKAVINVQNQDQACFAWSVVAAIHPVEYTQHPQRMASYPHYSTVLNFDGIEFPIKVKDIKLFESLNNISINVYGVEDKSIVGPLHYTTNKRRTHVNLLYIEEGTGNSHYCWIKDLSRLISKQLSKEEKKKYICDGCMQYFRTKEQLGEHIKEDCNKVRTMIPEVGKHILKFKNFKHQLRVPFVIYADFESILKPYNTCSPDPDASFTNTTHIHEPFSCRCKKEQKIFYAKILFAYKGNFM